VQILDDRQRVSPSSGPPGIEACEPRVRLALEIVRNCCMRRVTIEEIAFATNVSPSRLRHIFKKETGLSITKYMRLVRYMRARRLLQTTFHSVKEINGMVGGGDVSHFTRDYKCTYGETPTMTRLRAALNPQTIGVATSANK
jgi:transcriptional regulator GlxA family with amidase domain